jgi:hypothetical protein
MGFNLEFKELTPVQLPCNCSSSPHVSSLDGDDDDPCSFSFHAVRVVEPWLSACQNGTAGLPSFAGLTHQSCQFHLGAMM